MKIHNIQITGSSGLAGNQSITGSLTVTGDIIAQQYVVSSSVTHLTESFASGSHVFGNSSDDTHQFTGSVLVTGSVTVESLSTPQKISTIYGVNVATTSGNGGNLTIKAGGGYGAGNTAGNLYLGFGRGNSSALNGSIYFGVAQSTDISGLDNTYMTISSSGFVGIGTTSPSQLLEVVGGEIKAGRVDSTNEGGQVSFGRSTDNNTAWYIDAYGNVSSPQLRFVNVSDSLVAMTITGSRVGVGTSTPNAPLQISSATGTNVNPAVSITNTSLNGYGVLRLTGNSRGGFIDFYDNSSAQASIVGQGGNFYIYTNGDSSGTPKITITSAGNFSLGSSTASQSEMQNQHNAVGQGVYWGTAYNTSYADWIYNAKCERTNSSAYGFFRSISGGGDIEHLLRGDGNAYADASWNGGGADYAEYFEWYDGNVNNEDRRGCSVSLVENKIKIAEIGENVIGIVSANPSVVGDAAWNKWEGKYLRDDFNCYIRDENGERILNPDFDESIEYISRENRKEWQIIGLVGKLRLKKGQITNPNWIKMKDISSEVEEWLVK